MHSKILNFFIIPKIEILRFSIFIKNFTFVQKNPRLFFSTSQKKYFVRTQIIFSDTYLMQKFLLFRFLMVSEWFEQRGESYRRICKIVTGYFGPRSSSNAHLTSGSWLVANTCSDLVPKISTFGFLKFWISDPGHF